MHQLCAGSLTAAPLKRNVADRPFSLASRRSRKPSLTFDGRIPGMKHGAYGADDRCSAIYGATDFAELGICSWYRGDAGRRAVWTLISSMLRGDFHHAEAICDDFGNLVIPEALSRSVEAWGLPQ